MANYGINVWDGSVENCTFESNAGYGVPHTAVGINAEYNSNVKGCMFYRADCVLEGVYSSSTTDNEFYDGYLDLKYDFQVAVTGNSFEGRSGILVTGSCTLVTVSNNQFIECLGMRFDWNTYHHEFVIDGNTFADTDGIRMNGAYDQTSFGFENFAITNNQMGGIQYGGENKIVLGGTDSYIQHGIIAYNTAAIHVQQDASPDDAMIDITNLENIYDGIIQVSDNNIMALGNPPGVLGIALRGQDYDSLSAYVTGNTLYGTEGVFVEGHQMAVVSDNYISQPPGTGSFDADDVTSYIRVEPSETAIVKGNHISSGNKTGVHADKSVMSITAVNGVVRDNVIEGNEVAGTFGLDTALRIDGAFYITDNYYMCQGTRYAENLSPFPNEMVVLGSDSVLGSNGMRVDATGATNPVFKNAREITFSVQGDLSAGTGQMRWMAPEKMELISVSAMVGTAPTGAPIIIDVTQNGTTVFTTQGNRPTILATENDSGLAYPDASQTLLYTKSSFVVDVDQVGSTVAGEDLIVTVKWRPTDWCDTGGT